MYERHLVESTLVKAPELYSHAHYSEGHSFWGLKCSQSSVYPGWFFQCCNNFWLLVCLKERKSMHTHPFSTMEPSCLHLQTDVQPSQVTTAVFTVWWENSCGEVASSFVLKKTRYSFVELWVWCVQWMLWCCTYKPSVHCVIAALLLHLSYYWFLTRQCAIAEGVLLTFRDLGNARRAGSQVWAFCRH